MTTPSKEVVALEICIAPGDYKYTLRRMAKLHAARLAVVESVIHLRFADSAGAILPGDVDAIKVAVDALLALVAEIEKEAG